MIISRIDNLFAHACGSPYTVYSSNRTPFYGNIAHYEISAAWQIAKYPYQVASFKYICNHSPLITLLQHSAWTRHTSKSICLQARFQHLRRFMATYFLRIIRRGVPQCLFLSLYYHSFFIIRPMFGKRIVQLCHVYVTSCRVRLCITMSISPTNL